MRSGHYQHSVDYSVDQQAASSLLSPFLSQTPEDSCQSHEVRASTKLARSSERDRNEVACRQMSTSEREKSATSWRHGNSKGLRICTERERPRDGAAEHSSQPAASRRTARRPVIKGVVGGGGLTGSSGSGLQLSWDCSFCVRDAALFERQACPERGNATVCGRESTTVSRCNGWLLRD